VILITLIHLAPRLKLNEPAVTLLHLSFFGNMVTKDERRIREFKFKIDTEKELFNKKKTLFTSKLDLHLRKEIMTYYMRSISFYGAETWTL
jgi:hypothetical protein